MKGLPAARDRSGTAGVQLPSPNMAPTGNGGSIPPMEWDSSVARGNPQADVPTVIVRGMGWRMVASYLTKLGGEVTEPAPEEPAVLASPSVSADRRLLAKISGKGWTARLHEELEFTGALRQNRVEVRLSGEPDAIEHVLTGLRRMALMNQG